MLFLSTLSGLQPGDSLLVSGEKKKITMDIKAISDSPLQTVEIVINGHIAKSFPLNGIQKRFEGRTELEMERSSWICARCTDRDLLLNNNELALYESPPKRLNQIPSRLRYAHTSPIYIHMNDKKVAVEKSVEEGKKIIMAFKKFASQNAAEEHQKTILEAIRQAEINLTILKMD